MWIDIGIVALLIISICCFAVLMGFETRFLTRKTDRRAADLYTEFADSPRKQRRFAKEHDGAWREGPARSGSPR
jgi:hypothetical protein